MTQDLSIVGIDLAKSVFHLVGMDAQGKLRACKNIIPRFALPGHQAGAFSRRGRIV